MPTNTQYKVVYTAGCATGDTNSLPLKITGTGLVQHEQPTGTFNVQELIVYFINDTTFTLTLTGENANTIPFVGTLGYSYLNPDASQDPDPNSPTTGGCSWVRTGNQLVFTFTAPKLGTTGEWQLSDWGPAVPLTVKVKRRDTAITEQDCARWP